MGSDNVAGWIGALSFPVVTAIGYFKRKSLHSRIDNLEINLNKKMDDLYLAVIRRR